MANDDGPAGLSTRTIPVGSSPRGGKELAADEVADLFDRSLTREPGGLPMAAAAGLARDRRHVELVDARTQADTTCGPILARWLANEHGHVRTLDRTQVVDDPLGVRLGGADLGEVRAQQVGDHDPAAFVHLRPVERPR